MRDARERAIERGRPRGRRRQIASRRQRAACREQHGCQQYHGGAEPGPNQCHGSARRASSNGLGLAPRRILWTMVSGGAIAVFVRRVSNSWPTRQCPVKGGSCQLTRTQFRSVGRGPNASRVPIAHVTVSSMSCDTRRFKSDILRFASPSTLVPSLVLARGRKMGPARFSSPTRRCFLAASATVLSVGLLVLVLST